MKETMKKSILLLSLTFTSLFFLLPSTIFAERVLPRTKTTTATGTKTTSSSKGVSTSVKFRSDRRAIVVTFSSLQVASKVDYILSYSTRGTTQGASGAITSPTPGNITRELLFGTCSHGVCRYDSGITNAKFVVTTRLTNGTKVVKTFKLKV